MSYATALLGIQASGSRRDTRIPSTEFIWAGHDIGVGVARAGRIRRGDRVPLAVLGILKTRPRQARTLDYPNRERGDSRLSKRLAFLTTRRGPGANLGRPVARPESAHRLGPLYFSLSVSGRLAAISDALTVCGHTAAVSTTRLVQESQCAWACGERLLAVSLRADRHRQA